MKLTHEIKHKLVEQAHVALNKSYSPYSKNKVGAAVLAKSNAIYLGANIGNSCSTLNCCAEQAALVCAIMDSEYSFTAIAIVDGTQSPCYPCGRCLQLLSEYSTEMSIILEEGSNIVEYDLRHLLPYPFKRKEECLNDNK